MNTFQQPVRGGVLPTHGAPCMRQATFDDYPQIAAVQVRNGLRARPGEDWRRLWTGNPAYDGQFPIGWVLENESGEIVGTIGNLPLAYFFRGRTLRAAAATDWAVDPGYRAYSLLLLHQLSKQPGVDLLICTTVSQSSEPSYRAFRWSRVPSGTWNRAQFWITGYTGFLASALQKRGTPFARAFAYPGALALYGHDHLEHARRQANGTGYELDIGSEFDAPFERFWEDLLRENHDVLLALRTPSALAWHFRNALARNHVWIATASKGSRLVAYAIAERHDSPAYGLKRMRLVDAQALSAGAGALAALLHCLLAKCHENRIHVLENFGCWFDRPGVPQTAALHHRDFPVWAYYYKATDRGLSSTLAHPEVWAPTSLDGDQTL